MPIKFGPGASSAEVRGGVVRGERALYSVGARQGQRLIVRITSLESNAVVQIYAPGAKVKSRDARLHVAGKALPGAGEGDDATRWSGRLPRTGDYVVIVGASRGNATYRLSVAIH